MPKGGEFSEREIFSQEDVDDLVERGAIDAGEALSEMLEPVLKAVEGAESLEEIGEKIFELYPEIDSNGFQALLARAVFAAGLTGYAAARSPASPEGYAATKGEEG